MDDAETLYMSERWANADHLYGVAAECGLKRLMLAFGMPWDQVKDRPSAFDDKKHVNDIWLRYDSYRSGYLQGAAYPLLAINPFADWDVNQRYASRSEFDQARVERHRNGAEAVQALIDKARRDGLI